MCSAKKEHLLVRLFVPSDSEALEMLMGRPLRNLSGDALVAMPYEGSPLVGALSFSRIYSTWEARSISVNSVIARDETVRIRLLVELAKLCSLWGCSRIDTFTADGRLASALMAMGAVDLTEREQWHSYVLSDLKRFVDTAPK